MLFFWQINLIIFGMFIGNWDSSEVFRHRASRVCNVCVENRISLCCIRIRKPVSCTSVTLLLFSDVFVLILCDHWLPITDRCLSDDFFCAHWEKISLRLQHFITSSVVFRHWIQIFLLIYLLILAFRWFVRACVSFVWMYAQLPICFFCFCISVFFLAQTEQSVYSVFCILCIDTDMWCWYSGYSVWHVCQIVTGAFCIPVLVCSYLYQIAHLGDDDDEPEFSSSMPLEEGDTFFFAPRMLKNLVMVDEMDSLSPIMHCQVLPWMLWYRVDQRFTPPRRKQHRFGDVCLGD